MLNKPKDTEKIKDYRTYNPFDGKGKYICYYRMYYRNGWDGRWLDNDNVPLSFYSETRNEMSAIFDEIVSRYKYGCDYAMVENLKNVAYPLPNGRFLLEYSGITHYYLLEFATEYGNSDYPVRIYVYGEK